jgi:hypothetical protein
LFNQNEHCYKMNMDLLNRCADALRASGLPVSADPATGAVRVGEVTCSVRLEPRGIGRQAVGALRVGANDVLLVPYANAALAADLRAAGVPYMDAAGNAWIVRPPLVVSIEGRRPVQHIPKGRPALLAGGLQLVFALLADPEAIRLPYRELARRGGVSLGTVANTVAWLRDQGHVVNGREGLQLADPSHLQGRWELGYLEVLRGSLLLGRARLAGGASLDALLSRTSGGALIGGELAAAVRGARLVPASATLHVNVPLATALAALRLVPDPTGPVTLLRRFGSADAGETRASAVIAAPLLVRAELLASGDARVRACADEVLA